VNSCHERGLRGFWIGLGSDRCIDGVQLARLTQELQNIAQSTGFQRPLIIGIDQENGMVRCDTPH